jgi:hypothetical protein
MAELTIKQLEEMKKDKSQWVNIHSRRVGVDGKGGTSGVVSSDSAHFKKNWSFHSQKVYIQERSFTDDIRVLHERGFIVYEGQDKEEAVKVFNSDMRG